MLFTPMLHLLQPGNPSPHSVLTIMYHSIWRWIIPGTLTDVGTAAQTAMQAPHCLIKHRYYTSPSSTAVRQVDDGSPQSQTPIFAKRDCPVCLDIIENCDGDWICHGCLAIFHCGCMYTWVKHCREEGVNRTCPCW